MYRQPGRGFGTPWHQPPAPPSRYTVIKTLRKPGGGRGGNGGGFNEGIFLVRHNQTGKIYIEKQVLARDVRDGHAQREVHALKQLRSHRNICQLFEYDLDQKPYRVYLEFYDLGALDTLLDRYHRKREAFPVGFMWHTLLSLSAALLYCVQGVRKERYAGTRSGYTHVPKDWNSIVHRDIKPANIFISSDPDPGEPYPRIVLGDFGCSVSERHILSGTASEFTSRDTPVFRPPEWPQYSRRSDVYQVGLIMHCMGWSMSRPNPQLALERGQVPRDYGRTLSAILRACLRTDPDLRTSTLELPEIVIEGMASLEGRLLPEPLKSWAFG